MLAGCLPAAGTSTPVERVDRGHSREAPPSGYGRGVSHRYLRPSAIVGHVLVLAAALTCLRLGWWQWEVTGSEYGSAQNLGYALLWPVFAGSFVYMWLRFLQLEAGRDAQTDGDDTPWMATGGDPDAVGAGPADPGGSDATGERRHGSHRRAPFSTRADVIGIGTIGDDDDPELAAYNAALARLAEQERRRDG